MIEGPSWAPASQPIDIGFQSCLGSDDMEMERVCQTGPGLAPHQRVADLVARVKPQIEELAPVAYSPGLEEEETRS